MEGGWGRLTASWLYIYRIHVSLREPPPHPHSCLWEWGGGKRTVGGEEGGRGGKRGEGGAEGRKGMGEECDLSPPISSAHVDHMLQESPKPSLPGTI